MVRAADPEAVVYDSGLSGTVYGVLFGGGPPGVGRHGGRRVAVRGRVPPGHAGHPPASRRGRPRDVEAAAAGDRRRVQEALDVTVRLAEAGVVDRWQLHWYEPVAVLPDALAGLRDRLPDGFPIEAWEAGVFWPGDGYDPATHASETVRLVAELLAAGVERIVYLPVFYTLGGSQPRELWRGLYEPTGETRPAAVAYETMVALTTDASSFAPLPDGTGLAIDRPDGSAVVVWDRTLPAPPTGATATDPSGAPVPWTAAIPVGESPVVVRSPDDVGALRDDLGI